MTDFPSTDLPFAAFKDQHGDHGFAEWLRARNRQGWDAMIGHRFTRELAADRTPTEVFGRYLRFEHAFVRRAVTIFGQALVKAPSFDDQVHLIGVLHALAAGQDGFFERAFQTLDVASVPLPPAACALGEGALAIAETGSFEEIVSMMLAAEWMYLTWCRAAHGQATDAVAAEWIALHVDPAFEAQVTWLRQTIDRRGSALSVEEQEACASIFGRMLALEIGFHDAPYDRP